MIQLQNTLISSEVIDEEFVCNLGKCKGACCVEGDLGAPLDADELEKVHEVVPLAKDYLSPRAIDVLEQEGGFIKDEDGDFSTTTINGKECAFAFYDDTKTLKCSIEQAYLDGKTSFKKPISCHLYPIRLLKVSELVALNYDRWSICSDACSLGKELKVPVYKFLKEALVRKFGSDWYQELEQVVDEYRKARIG